VAQRRTHHSWKALLLTKSMRNATPACDMITIAMTPCRCLQLLRERPADGVHRGRGVHHLGRRRLQQILCRCLHTASLDLYRHCAHTTLAQPVVLPSAQLWPIARLCGCHRELLPPCLGLSSAWKLGLPKNLDLLTHVFVFSRGHIICPRHPSRNTAVS